MGRLIAGRSASAAAGGILAAAIALVIAGSTSPAAAPAADPELAGTLDRVSAKVRDYYQRAQTLVSTETVRTEQLGADYQPEGRARRLVYELRVEWRTPGSPNAMPEADVVRTLISVNGEAPEADEEPGCTDPRAVSPEPLVMLLPEHRREFGFSLGRPQRLDGQLTTTLDYISLPVVGQKVTWQKDCVSIPLEGRTRGRIWIDRDTDAVLKLEEHLVGMIDVRVPRDYARGNGQTWMYLERSDFSMRYEPVTFTDPDETLMLPAEIQSLRVFRGSRTSRMRITQTYSDYRRFLTRSRMLPPAF
jgi:hypothetical protein